MEKPIAQAFFLQKKGDAKGAFALKQFELPQLKPHEVLIKVQAFGLNFADVMARSGRYRDAPNLPYVPGYDVVGTVIQTGCEENLGWIGKRVAAFCRFGGYASHANTSVNALVEIGKDVEMGAALSLCTQGVTASYMAELIHPSHDRGFVLVHAAAGGVGSLLLQLLQQRGFKTIAKVGTPQKAERIQPLNPTEILLDETSDYFDDLKRILGMNRLIASFNATGGKSIGKDLSLIGSGGTLVLFGGAAMLGSRFKWISMLKFVRNSGFFSPLPLMMGSKGIVGVNMLRLADHHPRLMERHLKSCFQLYSEGKLCPLPSNEFKSQELAEAHSFLESGKSTGKVLVYWEGA
jgi:NADPH2:quinone reductase